MERELYNNLTICIPFVQRIMNAAYRSSIDATPASSVFGNYGAIDRGILIPYLPSDTPINLTYWHKQMSEKQAYLIRKVQERIIKQRVEGSVLPSTENNEGDCVIVFYAGNPPSKFHTPWKGPCRVIAQVEVRVKLQNIIDLSKRACFSFEAVLPRFGCFKPAKCG